MMPADHELSSELAHLTGVLKTPRIRASYHDLARRAESEGWGYERYLAAVLSEEATAREASGAHARITRAGFPHTKTLAEFDFALQPSIDRAMIGRLETSAWITQAANLVFLGPPGTGKTHLAIAFGTNAARQGYRVKFDTATGWITRLREAHDIGALPKLIKQLSRYHLLVIDEVGYLPMEADAASLFFQLVASRYEQGSLIITSNLAFSQWGDCFSDATMAAAIIDRVIHHATIISHEGTSYRLANHSDAYPPPAPLTR